jgi:hypothetical protein
MRTVRICAIIALGVAFGYAIGDSAVTNTENFSAKSAQAAAGILRVK